MKKTIIISTSLFLIIAIAALFVIAVVGAANEDMSISEYFAKLFKGDIVENTETVATVNGEKVNISNIVNMKKFTPSLTNDECLDYLIKQKLFNQEAAKRGITVSDEDLNNLIQYQITIFNEVNKADVSKQDENAKIFLEMLKINGMTIEEYFNDKDVIDSYRSFLTRSRLEKQIIGNETDAEKIQEMIESYTDELKAKADIVIYQKVVDKIK